MTKTGRFWTLRYIIINATYFAVYSGIHAYASVFLLEKGFSNTLIGITLALANILSVIFQPLIAGLIDKQGKLTNRNVSMASTAILLAGSILLLLIKNGIAVIFIIFALIYTVQMVYQPILTAMYFEYEAAGCHIYYGLARGLGSCGFAVVSVFTGMMIGRFGVTILMVLDIIFLTVALIVLYFFKKPAASASSEPAAETEVAHNNLIVFTKTYPAFMLFVVAGVCFFFAHNAINDYMIQIITPLGGTEASMGTAVFIAAILELPTMALIDKIMKKISVKNGVPDQDPPDANRPQHGRRVYQPSDADLRLRGLHPRRRLLRKPDHGQVRPGQRPGLHQLLHHFRRRLLQPRLRAPLGRQRPSLHADRQPHRHHDRPGHCVCGVEGVRKAFR